MKIQKLKIPSVRKIFAIAIAGSLLMMSGLAYAAQNGNSKGYSLGVGRGVGIQRGQTATTAAAVTATSLAIPNASSDTEVARSLTYVIEEEKLAHDVYVAMYEKWGIRIFNNIQKSETSHQNQVWTVMENRNLPDPRSSELGAFKDQSLQALYNKLVTQGNISTTEALNVGIAIEKLDISDIQKALSGLDAADIDVKSTYEILLNGSQRHLSAFNRQLSR